jgi:diguanylate cyclase (GGDEF)-like protein/PAS domain S-box-containing protein
MDPRSPTTSGEAAVSGSPEEVVLPTVTDAPAVRAARATPRSRSLIALTAGEPFEEFFEAAGVGLAMADAEGHLVRVNAAYAQLLGRAAEDLVGVGLVALANSEDVDKWEPQIAELLRGERTAVTFETRQTRADGSEAFVELELRFVESRQGTWIAVSVEDKTEERWAKEQLTRMTQELRRRALHDPLTGLPNRVLALDHLRRAMARQVRDGQQVAALYCDLNGFKQVNDLRGHAAGDQLLRNASDALQASVRPSDLVARLSGDEFLVILAPAGGESNVRMVVNRLEEAVAQAGAEEGVTVAIGWALTTPPSVGNAAIESPEELLIRADDAMYEVKRAHHDRRSRGQ